MRSDEHERGSRQAGGGAGGGHPAAPVHRGAGRADRDRLAGPLGTGGHLPRPQPDRPAGGGFRPGRRAAAPLRDGHVPVPERRGAARRPPAGLHRHRRVRPLPADVRRQRAAHDGLRRVRPARRAVRGGDRTAPPGDHRGQHPGLPPAAAPAGAGPRPAPRRRHHRRRVLPVDPVDLPADLRRLVRPGSRPRASGRRAGGGAGRGDPGAGRGHQPVRPPVVRAVHCGASSGRRRAPAGVPVGRGRQLVPGPGHGAGERGGHPGRAERAGQLPGLPAAADPVDAAHHGVRGPADRRPGHRRLARVGGADAAQLDRPVDRCADPVRLARG